MKIFLVGLLLVILINPILSEVPLSADRIIEVEPRYELQPQPVEERRWVDIDLRPLFTLEETDAYFFAMPRSPQFDAEGRLYVLDAPNHHVKKFSPDGTFLGTIGSGPGEGPGEVQRLVDLAVAPEGRVWLLNLARRGLSRFSSDGTFERFFSVAGQGMPDQVVLRPDGTPVVSVYGGADALLAHFSADGELAHRFGHLIEEQELAFLALDGYLQASGAGTVLAPSRASQLLRFEPDGTLRYAIETMDEVPYPTIRLSTDDEGRQSVRIAPRTRFATYNLSVSDGRIYLYSYPATQEHEAVVIDVYDEADGTYLRSFTLPGRPAEIAITDERVVTIQSTRVRVWAWNPR